MASRNDLYDTIQRWGQPRVMMKDVKLGLTLAWWGGHGVHAYAESGQEVSFWNTGSFADNDASESCVRSSMEDKIESGEYP